MASSSYDLGEPMDADERVAMWTKGAVHAGSGSRHGELEGFLMDLLIVLIEQNPNNNLEIFILRYLKSYFRDINFTEELVKQITRECVGVSRVLLFFLPELRLKVTSICCFMCKDL